MRKTSDKNKKFSGDNKVGPNAIETSQNIEQALKPLGPRLENTYTANYSHREDMHL